MLCIAVITLGHSVLIYFSWVVLQDIYILKQECTVEIFIHPLELKAILLSFLASPQHWLCVI